ncbi:hypothetical protein Q8H44_15495, partial [Acinetobacter lwoffii]|nr:hypothetical protein [Acinetobacter lwoffii]
HLPKLRLKFGSIRGALHFKSLCNKAYILKEKKYLYEADVRESSGKLEKYKLILNSELKCLSSTLGCESINSQKSLKK